MEPTTEQIVDWVRKQKRRRKFCPRCLQSPYHGASIKCLGCGLDFVEATYNLGYFLDHSKLKFLGIVYAQDVMGFYKVTHGRPQTNCSETGFAAYNLIREQQGREPMRRDAFNIHPDRECILWQQTLAKVKESLWPSS